MGWRSLERNFMVFLAGETVVQSLGQLAWCQGGVLDHYFVTACLDIDITVWPVWHQRKEAPVYSSTGHIPVC